MALHLSDAVIGGEIDNRVRNSVQGKIWLHGCSRPMLLDLTGNCARDLVGRSFRFERCCPLPIDQMEPASRNLDYSCLAAHHVGPVGTMSTIGNVQLAGCSPEELIQFAQRGDSAPLRWKQGLYLEWYSQHGRVVIELLDTQLTFVEIGIKNDWLEVMDADVEEDVDESLRADDETDPSDPFGLFPSDLDETLAAQFSLDPSTLEVSEVDPADDSGEEVPLRVIFDPPLKLAPSSTLTDPQIAESLQLLLARLARHGVALTMCPHFSSREAYQLLLERILPEETVPAELVRAGYVQHFTTHVYCPMCLSHFAAGESGEDLPNGND